MYISGRQHFVCITDKKLKTVIDREVFSWLGENYSSSFVCGVDNCFCYFFENKVFYPTVGNME